MNELASPRPGPPAHAGAPETSPRRAAALDATELRDWQQASQLWAEQVRAAPEDAEARLRLAEALHFAQSPAEAAEAAREAARLLPRDPRPLVVLARAETARDPAAAVAAWRGVVALAPGEFEAWARLAELQHQLGRGGPAMEALLRALALRPNHPFALALAARLLGSLPPRQRYDRTRHAVAAATPDAALALLHVAAELSPQDMLAQEALAKALLARQAHAQALPALRALAQANPQAPEPLARLAEALHQGQRWPEAIRIGRRLLHLRPQDSRVALRLAEALRRNGEAEAALATLREALAQEPGDLGLLHEQARCLAELDRPEATDAAWAAALAAHPHEPALRLGHAEHLLRRGREAEALAVLEPQVGAAPGFDAASLLLLRLLVRREPAEAVLRRFGAVLAAGLPPQPDATALELALRCGLLLLGCGRLAEATALLEPARAQAAAPPHLALRAGLRLLLARGEDAAARALANQALATHRRQPWAWIEVLHAFQAAEEAEFAAATLRRATQLFHDHPSDWLRVAEASARQVPGTELLARLAETTPASPADALRASRLALLHGAVAEAAALLAAAAPTPALAAAWARQQRLIARARALAPPTPEDFPALLLERLAALAAAHPARPEWRDGPILLVHPALGAGSAGRQIAATLRGLAGQLGGAARLQLVCLRLTEHAERRLHLPAVQEAGAGVTDLGPLDLPPLEASGLPPEAQELLALLGPGVAGTVRKLLAGFQRLRPGVVHVWHDDGALAGAIAALLAGVPRVLRAAHASRPRPRNPLAWRALAAAPRLVLANSSQAGAAEDAAWIGLPPARIGVLRHGFDLDRLVARAAPARAAALRAELGIPPGAPVVGGAMRLVEVKRPLLWVEACARLLQARPEAHFVLLGEGPLREPVAQRARALGLQDRLHLPGHVDPSAWLRLMDVALLTSSAEGLPRLAVAAQALGRPVVAVGVGGVPECLQQGVTGLALPPDDPDLPGALAAALARVLTDTAWREAARQAAPCFIGARFSLEAMTQRTLELYGLAAPAAPAAWLPPPGEVEREAATAAVQRQDWPAAQAQWDRLLALAPADEEALLGAAAARLHQGQLAEARALYSRALRQSAGAEALRGLARALRALREEREALPLWEALLRLQPRDLEAMLRSAEGRARIGDLSGAMAVLDNGRRLLGNDAALIRLQARLQAEAGNAAEALRLWNSLAEALPRDLEAQWQAGLAAQAVGNVALAERRLLAAAEGPFAARALAVLVPLLAGHGRATEARTLLRRGLHLAPNDAGLWRAGAQLLTAEGQHAALDRALARLRQRAGDDPAARLVLADRLQDADRYLAAQAELRALLGDAGVGLAAAERLVRAALRQGDSATATALLAARDTVPNIAELPEALQLQVRAASRFCQRLKAETGEAEPRRGLWLRVAEAARRRGYPRYLPQRDAVLHLLSPADAAACRPLALAEAADGLAVTLLHAGPGQQPPLPPADGYRSLVQASLADHALGVPEALATLPELAVPGGPFGEALRPPLVGLLVVALAATQPSRLVLWGLPELAEAALAALAQGVPELVLAASGAAPNLRKAGSEAAMLRLDQARQAMRAALLVGQARLWHVDPAALADWVAWLGLSPQQAATHACTAPAP